MTVGKYIIEKDKSTGELVEYVEVNKNKLKVTNKKSGLNIIFEDEVCYKEIDEEKCEIMELVKRGREYYFGILNVTSKTFYGMVDNRPIYQFRSCNRFDPIFMVLGKNEDKKNNLMDIYCLIKLEKWENGAKNPTGSIVERLGEVGSDEGEYNNILMRTEINLKSPLNRRHRRDYTNQLKTLLEKNDDFRVDFTNQSVFSIDPLNCQDIDDAIHINLLKDDYYQIGVHIADVSYYLEKNTEIDEYGKYRSFSIYTPKKRIDMLPTELATDICSLVPNEPRKTFTALFDIDKKSYQILGVQFVKGLICSKYKYDYHLAQEIIDEKTTHFLEEELRLLSMVSKNLEDIYLKKNLVFNENSEDAVEKEDKDSHRIIEVFAILTNHYVAKLIEEKLPSASIQRLHDCDEFEELNLDNMNLPPRVIEFMNLIRMKRAYYGFLEDKKKKITHWGLNLQNYTHFTSPIRRYNDILIHRILWGILTGRDDVYSENILIDICKRMNEVQDKLNRMEREYYRMSCLKELNYIENGNERDGWVIGIDNDRISVYFPDIKLLESINLYDEKNKHLLKIVYQDNKKIILENNIYKNGKMTIKLLDMVRVKMTVIMQSKNMNEKLKIKLIKPNLYGFINEGVIVEEIN